MSLGAVVSGVLSSLAPTFGAMVRWRRLVTTEQPGGHVTADLLPIQGVPDDGYAMLVQVDRQHVQRLFGPDTEATATVIVPTSLAVAEGDRLLVRSGPTAGTQYEIVARSIVPAGEMATLGLAARPPRDDWF